MRSARPFRPLHPARCRQLAQAIRLCLDDIEYLLAEGRAGASWHRPGPMPRIIPEARYFSMPSTDVGAEVLRKRALNCRRTYLKDELNAVAKKGMWRTRGAGFSSLCNPSDAEAICEAV